MRRSKSSIGYASFVLAVLVACSDDRDSRQHQGVGGEGGQPINVAGAAGTSSGGVGAPATGGMTGVPLVDAGSGSGGAAGTSGLDPVAGSGGAGGSMAAEDGGGGMNPSAPSGDCPPGDALELLRAFAPEDEDLASDFEGYVAEELGSAVCATEGTGGARTITQTIIVPPNAIYDGKGERLTADAGAMACDTSEGEQGESQRPFFVLLPGAQLKNVTITYPGCEGVHMFGDNLLDNIVWEDAGEDAASVRSYFPGGAITIKDSKGHKAADKMFQFNAPCDVRIERFEGSDMGKLVRQNGGSEFELNIDLNEVTVTGVISAVVQSDSPLCFVRHHELSYEFTGSGDNSDRVFRDIPAANVTTY